MSQPNFTIDLDAVAASDIPRIERVGGSFVKTRVSLDRSADSVTLPLTTDGISLGNELVKDRGIRIGNGCVSVVILDLLFGNDLPWFVERQYVKVDAVSPVEDAVTKSEARHGEYSVRVFAVETALEESTDAEDNAFLNS